MKEKILEILFKRLFNIVCEYDREKLAENIESLIKENYYPKEFVEWTYFQDKKIIVSDKTGIRLKTVDELYNDWVKDK